MPAKSKLASKYHVLKCPVCADKNEFFDASSLGEHLAEKHLGNFHVYTCPNCESIFTSSYRAKKHFNRCKVDSDTPQDMYSVGLLNVDVSSLQKINHWINIAIKTYANEVSDNSGTTARSTNSSQLLNNQEMDVSTPEDEWEIVNKQSQYYEEIRPSAPPLEESEETIQPTRLASLVIKPARSPIVLPHYSTQMEPQNIQQTINTGAEPSYLSHRRVPRSKTTNCSTLLQNQVEVVQEKVLKVVEKSTEKEAIDEPVLSVPAPGYPKQKTQCDSILESAVELYSSENASLLSHLTVPIQPPAEVPEQRITSSLEYLAPYCKDNPFGGIITDLKQRDVCNTNFKQANPSSSVQKVRGEPLENHLFTQRTTSFVSGTVTDRVSVIEKFGRYSGSIIMHEPMMTSTPKSSPPRVPAVFLKDFCEEQFVTMPASTAPLVELLGSTPDKCTMTKHLSLPIKFPVGSNGRTRYDIIGTFHHLNQIEHSECCVRNSSRKCAADCKKIIELRKIITEHPSFWNECLTHHKDLVDKITACIST